MCQNSPLVTGLKRNAPCLCGSGRKFKRCCGRRVPGADAVYLAQEWLYAHYQDEMPVTFVGTFFVGLEREDIVTLTTLPDPLVQMIDDFGYEVVVAEGEMRLGDDEILCLDLILGPHGPPLSDARRAYLEACGQRSVSFYEVVEPGPGAGFRVRDMIDEDEPLRWVAAPTLSQTLLGAQGSIFAARLIPGTPWTISANAVYPSQKPHIFKLLDQIREETEKEPDPREVRRMRRELAVFTWLLGLLMSPRSMFDAAEKGLASSQ